MYALTLLMTNWASYEPKFTCYAMLCKREMQAKYREKQRGCLV